MRIRTHVKAGKMAGNHNPTLRRTTKKANGVRVRSAIKAGKMAGNHNPVLRRAPETRHNPR